MTSRRSPSTGRVPLARSLAFRLGAAFAVVAIAASGITALLVNAAFAARFDHYLAQQRHAQLARITMAASRSYAGKGKWDLRALETLIPAVGTGTLRVRTPSGSNVWQWNGHQMSWNSQWMQSTGGHVSHRTGHDNPSGHGGTRHDCGSWENCGSWNNGSRNNGWMGSGLVPPTGRSATVLAAAAASPSPDTSPGGPAGLGTLQRIPIKAGGKVVGTALVRLPPMTALPDAVAFRGDVIAVVLASGAAGALLSLGLGIFFARRATRPLRDIARTAQSVAAGDRPSRLSTGGADEFGHIGQAINALADTADSEEELRQGFAAEVAHELRTPLTILRSQVEGLRVGVLQPDTAALASLDEEVQRISRLVADLQILGSADAAAFSLERTDTDLGKLADETSREFAALFEGAEVRLQTRLESVTTWADPGRVGQILGNLLSNALKYTPPGGLVRLQVTTEGPWAVIAVSDTGPGIPADELPHIFDRFFRGRAASPSGTGIGLTVVDELARAHGGTAEVSSEPGQGTTFTVRLPAQAHTGGKPLPNRSFTAAS
jgi:signal transduction histidine kinase